MSVLVVGVSHHTAPVDLLERLALDGEVTAIEGTVLAADAASLCLHGDTPDAVAMAAAVHEALVAAGVTLRAPW